MLDKDTLIKVVNRDNGVVGYAVPDLGNIRRMFQPKEEKEVTMEELRKLSYLPGGKTLLQDCLIIRNEEAISEILGDIEPEYYYTENDVKDLLLNGTLNQLKDCLDFAPLGVIDLVKNLAVTLKIDNYSKREAIKNKLGFDVTNAIENNKISQEEEKVEDKKRRAAVPVLANTEAEAPTRRTAAPKYKVTSIQK